MNRRETRIIVYELTDAEDAVVRAALQLYWTQTQSETQSAIAAALLNEMGFNAPPPSAANALPPATVTPNDPRAREAAALHAQWGDGVALPSHLGGEDGTPPLQPIPPALQESPEAPATKLKSRRVK